MEFRKTQIRTKNLDFQKGYQRGFVDGQSQTLKLLEKQFQLAYLSRPIVIRVPKESK